MNINRIEIAAKASLWKNDKYLILQRSGKEEINPNDYDIPGGRIYNHEKPSVGLVREVFEETGLQVRPIGIINTWSLPHNNFYLLGLNFFCDIVGGKEKISEEHRIMKWTLSSEILLAEYYPIWLKKTINRSEILRIKLLKST